MGSKSLVSGPMLSVHVLGPLEVVVGRQDATPSPRQLRVVFAALAVHPNQPVSCVELLDNLWEGHPPPGAAATLQGYVYRLRRGLDAAGPGGTGRAIRHENGAYLLTLAPDGLDAATFERRATEARVLMATGPMAGSERMSEALSLWRGPALAELAHLPSLQPEAARLEEARLRAIGDRVRAHLSLGRDHEVVAELEGLIRAHPLREDLVGCQMVALYRTGRQAEALAACQRLRRQLGDTLGAGPSPELAALEEAVLLHRLEWRDGEVTFGTGPAADRVHSAHGSEPVREPPAPVPTDAVVGRRHEQAALTEALQAAAAGRPTVVVVAGEAGIGKSRLVAELLSSARQHRAVVLAGGCSAMGESQVPFAALAQALRRYLAAPESPPAKELMAVSLGALARVVPEMAAPDDHPAAVLVPEDLLRRLLRTLSWLARRRPVVLVIEDLHWADPSTARFVLFLTRNLIDQKVLVVVTARTDEIHPRHPRWGLFTELDRCSSVRRIDLAALEPPEAAELVADLLGGTGDRALVDRIVTRSGGNPLFIRELVAGHREGTALRPTLREMLVARCLALGTSATTCIRVLAVAVRRLDHHVLADAAQLGERELLTGLRTAVDHRLVTIDDHSYRVAHPLVAEAVAADLLPGERSALHAALGAALGRAGDDHAEVLPTTGWRPGGPRRRFRHSSGRPRRPTGPSHQPRR